MPTSSGWASVPADGRRAQQNQCDDGQNQEPEGGTAIGGIGEFNQIRQPADQERHAGHDGVAEGRAERDHQKQDSRPGHHLPGPVCSTEKKK